MNLQANLAGAMTGIAILCSAAVVNADVMFWSTQARPVEEAQAMRDTVLSEFDGTVDYQPNEDGPLADAFTS